MAVLLKWKVPVMGDCMVCAVGDKPAKPGIRSSQLTAGQQLKAKVYENSTATLTNTPVGTGLLAEV